MLLLNYFTLLDLVLRDVRAYVAELAGMKVGDKVLDVCCGTGDQICHYAQKGIIATGVDQNPSVIELAERNRERRDFQDVSFFIASATALPFPDGYFDGASISLGLHEMTRNERDVAVSEMKRVVKKGGALIFIDFQVPLPKNSVAYLIRVVEFIAGRDNHRRFRDYIEQGGLGQILRQNGLTPQKQTILKFGVLKVIRASNPLLIA